MLRRSRLIAVWWLLAAALMQSAAPAQAAAMCARMCAEMAAQAPAHAGGHAGMDMHGLHEMADMDMSGMDMSGMGHGGAPDEHGPGPVHCGHDCCNGALVRLAAPPPPLWSAPAPPVRIVQVVWTPEASGPSAAASARLWPAIRAPPAA